MFCRDCLVSTGEVGPLVRTAMTNETSATVTMMVVPPVVLGL